MKKVPKLSWLMMLLWAILGAASLSTISGCAAANKTQAHAFGSDVEFGGGLYLQEAEPDWD